ncbi:unnamed protein product [Ranitomeya imitator]|uniref:Myosin motor domain-containing protein n=1 Tax=Ranitomeya imitator TaxID=111125 RepID=A0ABN9LSH5_9NEOB|nr:unnamed protein product [Ranitomeya imitator]
MIHTMIQARKPSSSRIYYRTWKAYFRWCESNHVPPMVFSLPSLLAFLQAGLDSGLALGSLKGQVSALSILFQKTLASRPQVKTFFQGVAHAVPPYRASVEAWDLNLVLDVLRVSPFEPLRESPLSVLSWKVAFLVAITSIRRVSELAALSCRPPFLVIHQDKVVFRPPPSFLPKVVSTFHLNEDIVLPSFCPAPTHPLERSLNKLDVVRAVRIYLDRTSSFRKTDSFFVIPDGTRRGQPASKATIARWIRMAILEAYWVKNRVPPPGIKAHSTRAVGASWAVHHRASALQLCKAATWSSIHTFAKFYKVHTYASADASLGRRILQAAVNLLDSQSLKIIMNMTLHDRTTKSLLHLHKKKKPPSISAQFQASLNKLLETLGKAEPFFIRCIRSNSEKMEMTFDEALVLQQLRYTGMLETVRIRRSGYSAKYTYQEFKDQFQVLLPKSSTALKETITSLLEEISLDPHNYQLGKTKVFFFTFLHYLHIKIIYLKLLTRDIRLSQVGCGYMEPTW